MVLYAYGIVTVGLYLAATAMKSPTLRSEPCLSLSWQNMV